MLIILIKENIVIGFTFIYKGHHVVTPSFSKCYLQLYTIGIKLTPIGIAFQRLSLFNIHKIFQQPATPFTLSLSPIYIPHLSLTFTLDISLLRVLVSLSFWYSSLEVLSVRLFELVDPVHNATNSKEYWIKRRHFFNSTQLRVNSSLRRMCVNSTKLLIIN